MTAEDGADPITGDPSFRDGQPSAWSYHRASSRWLYNAMVASDEARAPLPGREHLDAPLQRLPPPSPLDSPLAEALIGRVSVRAWADESLRLDVLSTLLWGAYGVLGRADVGPMDLLERPAPSGGGLYPLELYVVVRAVDGLPAGVHHYVPLHHGLERLREHGLPEALVTYLFMGQPVAAEAAAVIVLTAVPGRSLWKYGDRGYRYILLEAGHVAQNVNLAAVALGAGSCNLGGFLDDELAAVLRVDVEDEFPLYGIAVGHPDPDVEDPRGVI